MSRAAARATTTPRSVSSRRSRTSTVVEVWAADVGQQQGQGSGEHQRHRVVEHHRQLGQHLEEDDEDDGGDGSGGERERGHAEDDPGRRAEGALDAAVDGGGEVDRLQHGDGGDRGPRGVAEADQVGEDAGHGGGDGDADRQRQERCRRVEAPPGGPQPGRLLAQQLHAGDLVGLVAGHRHLGEADGTTQPRGELAQLVRGALGRPAAGVAGRAGPRASPSRRGRPAPPARRAGWCCGRLRPPATRAGSPRRRRAWRATRRRCRRWRSGPRWPPARGRPPPVPGPCGRTSQPDMQTSHDHAAAAAATATAVPTSCGCSGSSAQTAQAKVGISPAGGPVRTASETSLVSPATSATTTDAATNESLKAATDVPAATDSTSVTAGDREQLGLRPVRLVAGVERGEATERRERQQAQVVGEPAGAAGARPWRPRRGRPGRWWRRGGGGRALREVDGVAELQSRAPFSRDASLATSRGPPPSPVHPPPIRVGPSPYSGSTASTATSPRMRAASTTAA